MAAGNAGERGRDETETTMATPGLEPNLRRTRFEERLDRAILQWDRHLSGCPECLSYGEHLCIEGGYASEAVEEARIQLETALLPQRPMPSLFARAARVPGVPI